MSHLLSSPAFTGIPTAPTAAGGTNTTQLATTAFVVNALGTANSIPKASLVNMTQAGLLGASAAGAVSEITLGTGLSFSGNVLNASASGGGLTYSTVADTNTTITGTDDKIVTYTSITAARTVTLPSVSAQPGQIIWVADASGSVTPTIKITVAAAGTDKIQGTVITSLDIQAPYSRVGLISDGTKWIVLTRQRKVYRWHFDGALATTTKQPNYKLPTSGRIMQVRHMPQTAGTGTIIIKVAGSDTYTITCSSGNSITDFTSDSTTQTAVAADALLHCRCSVAGTEADVTVEVVVDEWTV